MRRDLPTNQYLRMAENRFTTNEACFIDLSKYVDIVDPNLRPLISDPSLPVCIGVDASTKHDQTALVAVGCFSPAVPQVPLVAHRIYQPSPDDPLDFEATVERTLLEWYSRFSVQKILFDPYQMQSTAQRLRNAGLPITEFPQTSGNTDCGVAKPLRTYHVAESGCLSRRAHTAGDFSKLIAKESPRGWLITKANVVAQDRRRCCVGDGMFRCSRHEG